MTDVQSGTFARGLHLFLFILKAQIKKRNDRVTEPHEHVKRVLMKDVIFFSNNPLQKAISMSVPNAF